MSPSMRNRAAIAVATFAAAGALSSTLLPSQADTPAERRAAQEQQLADQQEAINERRRRRGDDLGEAVRRDRLRPAEHRPPDAGAAARALLRRGR